MKLSGAHLIANQQVIGSSSFKALNPFNGEESETNFSEGTIDHANQAADLAELAFESFRQTSSKQRAEFLESIADEIMNIGDKLFEQVHLETALPLARIQGECTRTCGQLRLFAQTLREGSWVNAIIDTADEKRQPLAKPDTRSMQLALGPVVVFGASNFPLAFSTAGGDTASALAAGCPVIVKGHPAHPGTSELMAQAINKAVNKCGLPEGIFSLIQSSNYLLSEALVKHPKVKAVGFTGSLKAGRILFDMATSRPEPIPFYGELGSINPVFVFDDAIEKSEKEFAENYINSLTLGVGQFCTNPGLLVLQASDTTNTLMQELSNHLVSTATGTMLTQGIGESLSAGIDTLKTQSGVKILAQTPANDSHVSSQNILMKVSAERFIQNPHLHEEVFGPVGLIVLCKNQQEILAVADALKGQLTATIHTNGENKGLTQQLFNKLNKIAGRVLFNGFPTGVEVNRSMVHGGCYPATTDSRSTSVGSNAIYRFTRPVCCQ
jgi:NADP-dependent aldehyde dehydrogenase